MKRIFDVCIILCAGVILVFLLKDKNVEKPKEKKKDNNYNITYKSEKKDACLTFLNEKEYSLYDCDSEPTDYFFDSENECTYSYDKEYMTFDCKHKNKKIKDYKIQVIKWDKKEFTFIYNKKEVTFKK